MQLECRIGMLNLGLDQLGLVPAELFEFIEGHFRVGSHGDIRLRCVGPMVIDGQLAPTEAASALELHSRLARLTGNPVRGGISRIGILLAHSYSAVPDALGVMFDRGFTTPDDPNAASIYTAVPREGCAVFLGEIARLRGTGPAYTAEVLFTAVHELGHVFNLQHETNWLTFMTPSQRDAPYGAGAYHFSPKEQQWLALCSTNREVWPGGSPFLDPTVEGHLNGIPGRVSVQRDSCPSGRRV
jgi:hypothetical protein